MQSKMEIGRMCRSLRLSASYDGKSVRLIEADERKVGIQHVNRFEITTGELIALIRAHGAELPGENHVSAAYADATHRSGSALAHANRCAIPSVGRRAARSGVVCKPGQPEHPLRV